MRMLEAEPRVQKIPLSLNREEVKVEDLVERVVKGAKRKRVGEVGREVDLEKAQSVGLCYAQNS